MSRSRKLIDEPPRMFSPSLATSLGLNEAIFLQQLHFWLTSDGVGREAEGEKWVYNTIPEWKANFPWWSERTIWKIINNLEKAGILVSANYNALAQDRTKWYRIDYDKLDDAPISQDTQDHLATLARPLPYKTIDSLSKKKDYGGRKQKEQEPAHPDKPLPDQPAKPDKPISSGQLDITSTIGVTQTVSLLAEAFSLKTGIPVPNPVSQRNWAAYNVRWGGPLRNLLNLCQTYGNTVTLMNKAIDRMRADRLTISAPQSIEQVAIAIYGENKGGRTGYW